MEHTRLKLEKKRRTVLGEDGARLKIMDDFGQFLKGTGDLLPRHELGDLSAKISHSVKKKAGLRRCCSPQKIKIKTVGHLFGELPELFKVDVAVGQPVGAALVEEVEVLDEQREEGHDDALALVLGAGRAPHGRLQRRPVAAKVGRRIHLMFQDRELGRLHLLPLSP